MQNVNKQLGNGSITQALVSFKTYIFLMKQVPVVYNTQMFLLQTCTGNKQGANIFKRAFDLG